jgi:hypothetical protein
MSQPRATSCIMGNKLINFCINIKLFAIIYDYLETSHTIQQKKGPNPSPKIINITLNQRF